MTETIESKEERECFSCGEGMPRGECPNSQRPCGHHCNHAWDQDICHWCGKEFGEDTSDPAEAPGHTDYMVTPETVPEDGGTALDDVISIVSNAPVERVTLNNGNSIEGAWVDARVLAPMLRRVLRQTPPAAPTQDELHETWRRRHPFFKPPAESAVHPEIRALPGKLRRRAYDQRMMAQHSCAKATNMAADIVESTIARIEGEEGK